MAVVRRHVLDQICPGAFITLSAGPVARKVRNIFESERLSRVVDDPGVGQAISPEATPMTGDLRLRPIHAYDWPDSSRLGWGGLDLSMALRRLPSRARACKLELVDGRETSALCRTTPA